MLKGIFIILIGDERERGICSHASGVGAFVTFESTLVVLGEHHGEHLLTADKTQERECGTGHELLDNDFSVAELVVQKHILESCLGFCHGLCDHNAFSGCQAVILQDNRHHLSADIFQGLLIFVESLVGRSRNIVFLHKALGEVLAGLDGRGGLGGTENRLSGGSEQIDDSR